MEGQMKHLSVAVALNNTIKHPSEQNSFLITPLKGQLSTCPPYTNDSDDSSLPNTDMSLSSLGEGRGRSTITERNTVTAGEHVMIF